MEFKVKAEEYNPLLKRKDLMLEIPTEGSPTPTRLDIRKTIAAKYGTKVENVLVRRVEAGRGAHSTKCILEVYDDPVAGKRVVPLHIRNRNLPPEERVKKQKKEKQPSAPAAEAKPARK